MFKTNNCLNISNRFKFKRICHLNIYLITLRFIIISNYSKMNVLFLRLDKIPQKKK